MDKPLCSIIVPIFNAEKNLKRCIQSILDQTYENFELILINDGSTDSSKEICINFSLYDSRILYFEQNNQGIAITRNNGVKYAHGDYIFFVDSDDYVYKDFCKVAIEAFSFNKSDIVIFGFNTILLNKNKTIKHHVKDSKIIDKLHALQGTLIDGYINSLPWNKAYKKELFNGIYYPEGRVFEDVGTTYKLIDKANNIYITDKITYNYELRGGSLSNNWWHIDKKINDFFFVRNEQVRFISEKYPTLLRYSYATTGFVAIMAATFLKEENKDVTEFLRTEKVNLIHSAFPYSILFRLWYCFPIFSRKVLKLFFK